MALPAMILIVGLFLAGLYVRQSIRQRPRPRQAPGELDAETHVMILAAFRLHSWVLGLNTAVWAFGIALRADLRPIPGWLVTVGFITFVLLILTARRLYWRLGYDDRRWFLLLAHLSPPFWYYEYHTALRPDIEAYLESAAEE